MRSKVEDEVADDFEWELRERKPVGGRPGWWPEDR